MLKRAAEQAGYSSGRASDCRALAQHKDSLAEWSKALASGAGVGSNPTAVTCLAQSHSFHVPGLHGQLLGDSPAQLQRGTLCTLSLCDGCQTLKPSRPQLDSVPIEVVFEVLTREAEQAGYSSVGRASDCRALQLSDGPWFDSGWPDLHRLAPQAVRSCAASDTEGIRAPAGRAMDF